VIVWERESPHMWRADEGLTTLTVTKQLIGPHRGRWAWSFITSGLAVRSLRSCKSAAVAKWLCARVARMVTR
jgi:hypothetical protein